MSELNQQIEDYKNALPVDMNKMVKGLITYVEELKVESELSEREEQRRWEEAKRYREAFHEIRRIDNDPDVNYCEFASLVKDIVDESLKNG